MNKPTLPKLCLQRNFYDTKILAKFAHRQRGGGVAGTTIFESTGCDIETLQDEDIKYTVVLSVVNCVRKVVNKQSARSIRDTPSSQNQH